MGYSAEIFNKVKNRLYEFRKKSQEDLESRRLSLYEKSPRAKEIEKELSSTAVKAAKAVLRGSDTSQEIQNLRLSNLKLREELGNIIKMHNLPEDYLSLTHKCSKCEDTGFIDGIMCSCMKNLLQKEAYEELNKLSPLSLSTFESFSLDYYQSTPEKKGVQSPRARMELIFDYCFNYAKNFNPKSPSITMIGATGLGKTHLSLAIANLVINRGFGVIYVSVPDMVLRLEKERFKETSNIPDSENHFKDCQLLILDDLGTEFSTQFSNSSIYNIINSRMMTSKPTIINTNLSIKELEHNYTQRMVSRIIGGNIKLEFIGVDIRQQRWRAKNVPK